MRIRIKNELEHNLAILIALRSCHGSALLGKVRTMVRESHRDLDEFRDTLEDYEKRFGLFQVTKQSAEDSVANLVSITDLGRRLLRFLDPEDIGPQPDEEVNSARVREKIRNWAEFLKDYTFVSFIL